MVSYAGQFRSLVIKKQLKAQLKADNDDNDNQPVFYIHNPKKYSMIDLNDWVNIQQKQLEKSTLSPPDKIIMKNCEEISHKHQYEYKSSQANYLSSPFNELFPISRFKDNNDKDKDKVKEIEVIDSNKAQNNNENEDRINNKRLSIDNQEELIHNKEDIGDSNTKEELIEKTIKDNNENIVNTNESIPIDNMNMKVKSNWNKREGQRDNGHDDLTTTQKEIKDIEYNYPSRYIDLNITQDQMSDFQSDVNLLQSKIEQKIKIRNIKPKYKTISINSKLKPKGIQFPFANSHKAKPSTYNTPSQLHKEEDSTNNISTQILLNKSNALNYNQESSKMGQCQYDNLVNNYSSFSTQIPYQIPVIHPIYHYGEYAADSLTKRAKMARQQSNLFTLQMNEQQPSNKIKKIELNNRSLSSQNIYDKKLLIKKTKSHSQNEPPKSKKELLYYKKLQEQLNKFNEEYIAKYKERHVKEIEQLKKQTRKIILENKKFYSNSNISDSNIDKTKQRVILPSINNSFHRNASQVYSTNTHMKKCNDNLKKFLFENHIKGMFGNYETFNSKIAQIRSILKR